MCYNTPALREGLPPCSNLGAEKCVSGLDFLVIGHVCRDLTPQGVQLGGTATYAATTALRMGLLPGIVTRAAQDVVEEDAFQGVQLYLLPSEVTTTFENVYRDSSRQQFIHAVAGPIALRDVPAQWQGVPIVLLAPLAQEVDPGLGALFAGSLVGVVPQGWMRQWDGNGRVRPTDWTTAEQVLPGVKALILSEEDVGGDMALVRRYGSLVDHLVLTQGALGATLHCHGRATHLPARPAREVDPTGAGDVFAAAFLIRLQEAGDPVEAARFANAVASFSVEAPGVAGIPDRRQVEAWLTAHPDWGWPGTR